jgi:hypothetical protein
VHVALDGSDSYLAAGPHPLLHQVG